MAISSLQKPIFIHARRVNDLPVVIYASQNKLMSLINGISAPIQGISTQIHSRDIPQVKALLRDECTLRIFGYTLLVGFKLRGGSPPWNGSNIPGKLPSTEDVMKDLDLGLDMTILSLNLIPTLALLLKATPAIGVGATILGATLSFFKSRFDSTTFNHYKAEVDRLNTQSLDDGQKLATMDTFLQAKLPNDLKQVKGLEDGIAQEIERLSQANNEKALREFIEIAACIYRYKDAKQASLLRTYGLALSDGLSAIAQLAGVPNAPKWLGQVLTAIRATLGTMQLSSASSNTNSAGVEQITLLLQRAYNRQSDEVKERLNQVEGLIGRAWVGLTKEIESTREDVQQLKEVSNLHFINVVNSLNHLSSKIDAKANQAAKMQLIKIRGRIKNAPSPMHASSYSKLIADVWTWANQLSGFPGLIDSNLDSTEELGFFMGRLASLYGYQKAIHNPYVWALCCDAYLDLRTDVIPDQPIPQLSKQTAQFQSMIDAGENTLQFVEKVQRDKVFFKGLTSKYKQLLIQIKQSGFTPQLFTQFDESCSQLRCFLRLCFNRSLTQDLFFISLLSPQKMFAHGLMDANELQQHLQTATSLEEGWENLLESVDLLEKVIIAKIDSHEAGRTDDQYILLSYTLYKLYKFAQKEFKNTLPNPSRRVFNTLPCHFTDLQALCQKDLLLAAKLGVVDEVIDLIEKGNQDPNVKSPMTGRTPLHEAAKYNHENVVSALLTRGARGDITDAKRRSPIDDAKKGSRIEKMLKAKFPTGPYKVVTTLSGHTRAVRTLLESDGILFSGDRGTPGTVIMWDLNTGNRLKTIQHPREITAMFKDRDGHILTGAADSIVRILNSNGDCIGQFKHGEGNIDCITQASNGCYITSGGDVKVNVWDKTTRKLIRSFPGDGEVIEFTPGMIAFAAGRPGNPKNRPQIKIYNLANGQHLRSLFGFEGCIYAIKKLHDGMIMASSSEGSVRIWDPHSGQCIQAFSRKGRLNAAVEISDDLIAATGQFPGISIWSRSKGTLIENTGWGHANSIMPMIKRENGDLITGSLDKTIKIWRRSEG